MLGFKDFFVFQSLCCLRLVLSQLMSVPRMLRSISVSVERFASGFGRCAGPHMPVLHILLGHMSLMVSVSGRCNLVLFLTQQIRHVAPKEE